MQPKFEIAIESIRPVNELPGIWDPAQCRELLQLLEFDSIDSLADEELREYAIMALQDLEPPEAAAKILETLFGDSLPSGKRQNLSEDMQTDRTWEEYPDLTYHERLFAAHFLLHLAFPETPQPEVKRVELILGSLNQAAEAHLQQTPPEPLIVRCLADALPADSILNRLFEDQIQGKDFDEAQHLVWHVEGSKLDPQGPKRQRRHLALLSPARWVGDLEEDTTAECEPFVPETE